MRFPGETSTAYGGGAPDYSNRFVSTFMWLDKLGLAAKNGLDLVVRQSFFKGYYALLYDDYDPAPVNPSCTRLNANLNLKISGLLGERSVQKASRPRGGSLLRPQFGNVTALLSVRQ